MSAATSSNFYVRTHPDPVLRKHCRPVAEHEFARLAGLQRWMLHYLDRGAFGIAAPQLGVSLAVIAFRDGRQAHIVINPKLTLSGALTKSSEGCLSLAPGRMWTVLRHQCAHVEGSLPNGRLFTIDCAGLAARTVQHEVDHLQGILLIDKPALVTQEDWS